MDRTPKQWIQIDRPGIGPWVMAFGNRLIEIQADLKRIGRGSTIEFWKATQLHRMATQLTESSVLSIGTQAPPAASWTNDV